MKKLNKQSFFFIIFFYLTLTSCVGPLVEEIEVNKNLADTLKKEIPTFTRQQIENKNFNIVGQFKATSCYNNFILDSPASEDKALDQIRLKASNVGADGILNPYCQSMEGTSLAKNCWYSFTCNATAIRFNRVKYRNVPNQSNFKENEKLKNSKITSGSGFIINTLGHILTNDHVVEQCTTVNIGYDSVNPLTASVLKRDKRNDIALLKLNSETLLLEKIENLFNNRDGLLRLNDIELGEEILVAGYPFGELYSNTIKVTGGMISASRGMNDDSTQFQIDAAVQPGNSGGPIYDESGNIIGMVIAQLDKIKIAKATGSLPENVNFGIKVSTLKQFLDSIELEVTSSKNIKIKSKKELAQISKNQTVMVVCKQ